MRVVGMSWTKQLSCSVARCIFISCCLMTPSVFAGDIYDFTSMDNEQLGLYHSNNNTSTPYFKFHNCNNTPTAMYFNEVGILPDPVKMQWKTFRIALMYDVIISETVGVNKIELDMSIRVRGDDGGFVELCRFLPVDVCYTTDLCRAFKQAGCEEYLKECKCPIEKGRTRVDFLPVPRNIPAPPFLVQGQFAIEVNLKEKGRPIGCLSIEVCVNSCEF